jgi:cation diffusion facilitator CzcD-associated flavoprotein CzcO
MEPQRQEYFAGISDGVVIDGRNGSDRGFLPNGHSHALTKAVRVVSGTLPPMTNGTKMAQRDMDGDSSDEHAPRLNPKPAYSVLQKLRTITIGAGFSGMIFAHKLRYEHPEMEQIVDNTIYEARSEVGGTWLVNTYPGVQCDVPSHIYAFPFDPSPDWDRFYSTGPQIQEYIVRTVKKWDLDRDVQFNTRVVGLYWQEELSQWKVTVEHDGKQHDEYADVVISGQGFLNTWQWPRIPGLQEFEGHKIHSAAWDHSFDPTNKQIAVIGNGSSGVQILPQMAKAEGTQVISFQRGPTWIVSRMDPGKLLGKSNIGSNPVYTEEDKRKFRLDRESHHQYRRKLIHNINKAFRMVCTRETHASR